MTIKENNKLVNYEFMSDTNNIKLTKDSLIVYSTNYKFRTSIKDIYGIRFPSKGGFEYGVLLGAGLGFGLGFIAGGIGYNPVEGNGKFNFILALLGGIVLSIPTGIIGGFVAAILPHTNE